MNELTWKCHICGDERPDNMISVHTTDLSEERGLPAGTMKQNVRYCNDNAECTEKAKTHMLFTMVKTGRTQCKVPNKSARPRSH